MPLTLAQLLEVRTYQAFDIDATGRVLAGGDDSGTTQLAEIVDGQRVPLTALAGACYGRYLPGQRAVVVSHDFDGNERHQLSLLRLPVSGPPASFEALEPLVRDPRFMHTLADVSEGRICYFTNRRNGVAFDPVVRDLAEGTERALLLGERSFAEAAISPDGRWLALAVHSPVTANAQHIALVDLTTPPGQERLIEVTQADAAELNLSIGWVPASDALYFSSNTGREFTGVARYDVATGLRAWLITDELADLTGWLSPDGSRILVERNTDGASALALHDAADGALLRELTLPGGGLVTMQPWPARWAPDGSAVAVTVSGPELPSDVLLLDARAGGQVRQLTNSASQLGGEATALPERHLVPTPDGEVVPCMVYRPTADPAGPLAGSAVLVIHGGPESQARVNFNPTVQALAAAGHTVLVPNVRGSTGYGKRWYSADDKHRRLDSVADLAALHAYLPALGVDPDRAALWGASYGGYMVLAGLAFQPELWAAGVDLVGIASLVTFLRNTSAYRRAYREREYGTLADDLEFLHAASALTTISDVRAPLFVIHGANDPRVPLSEAEQIHAALTDRGLECELVVYGDEGHGLARRANRADAMPRAIAFLARQLRKEES